MKIRLAIYIYVPLFHLSTQMALIESLAQS